MAQLGPPFGAVEPSGGMSIWKRSLQPSRKLSRHGRLIKAAKRIARRAVHHTCQEADKEVYKNIDPKSSQVYRLANQFRRDNANAVANKPMKNDAGDMSVSEDSMRKAWLEHYQRRLNAELDCDPKPPDW